MNAFEKALSDLTFRIPPQILEAVFVDPFRSWEARPRSLTEIIASSVVRPRVCVDVNLNGGGRVARIPLNKAERTQVDLYVQIFRIPKALTEGCSILSADSVSYMDITKLPAFGLASNAQNSQLLQGGQAVMDVHAAIPVISTARVTLIAENTIMVRDTITLPSDCWLNCRLMLDETLSNLQPTSYRHFSKLVELAVKSYIYNQFIVYTSEAELAGGQGLSQFRTTIESYADAEELYQDYLKTKWEKVNRMNDTEQFTKLTRLTIGGMR